MNMRAHSRLADPSRSAIVFSSSVPAIPVTESCLPSTKTLLPCSSRPRSDPPVPPTDHHVQAYSPHVAPAPVSPPPPTDARSTPIASNCQRPLTIPMPVAPELQLYVLHRFSQCLVERWDGISSLPVDRHALLNENAGGAQPRGRHDRYFRNCRSITHK